MGAMVPGYAGPWGVPYGYPYYPPLEPAAKVLAKSANGVRWGAAFLDCVIVVAVYFALQTYVRPTMQTGIGPPFIFITLLWGFGYYIIPDALGAATPAKLLTGLRVVDINLKPATFQKMALRSLELPVWLILGGLIFLIVQAILASSSGQSLGDKLAKTYVVRKKDLAKVPAQSA
jgi:uncharacterized RDD family membrane protein YckC